MTGDVTMYLACARRWFPIYIISSSKNLFCIFVFPPPPLLRVPRWSASHPPDRLRSPSIPESLRSLSSATCAACVSRRATTASGTSVTRARAAAAPRTSWRPADSLALRAWPISGPAPPPSPTRWPPPPRRRGVTPPAPTVRVRFGRATALPPTRPRRRIVRLRRPRPTGAAAANRPPNPRCEVRSSHTARGIASGQPRCDVM